MIVPPPIILENVTLLDVRFPEPSSGSHIHIEGGKIREISTRPIKSAAATRIDLGGRIVMPGLIDCHVHVTAASVDLGASAMLPDSFAALKAAEIMRGMLQRGFTTVRDLGGADHGLVRAVEEGLIPGPRLIICGKALSQTGGHGDFRGRYDDRQKEYHGRRIGSMARICDGVDAVRNACREEIKAGATFIKIMANGGVSSPTDPISFLGFSRDEIAVAVEEAANAQTYVAAHLYTDEAIRRAVELGVKSVEHANLVEPQTAELMAAKGVFVCPTLITYEALRREGASLGFPKDSIIKIEDVRERGLKSIAILHKAGVKIVYGTDLLGPLHEYQLEGLSLLASSLSPAEVIRSATTTASQLLGMEGSIGCIAEGAHADLIVPAANPLKDIANLAGGAGPMLMVMKGGRIFYNSLN